MSESEVLSDPGVLIVVAEPGAGKSSILRNIAKRFNTKPVKASVFERFRSPCIVVDAFDEVARTDVSALRAALKELRHTDAKRTVISSRSSEWHEAETRFVEDLLGIKPAIARLIPLSETQQRTIFQNRHPDADFERFLSEVSEKNLLPILGNPEFLNIFSDAFIEAGGFLRGRAATFSAAVRHLARESNPAVSARYAPTTEQKIGWADEIFARLLLSGSGGVAVSEPSEGATFPRLEDLGIGNHQVHSILDTRLFQPAAGHDRHEPVHRMIAEFCAARALSKRITAPHNSFSLQQCLALIAPNGFVRDDLSGLAAWLAALGNQEIQDAIIKIAPYTVFANGDPESLTATSRGKIISKLRDLVREDPYFRGQDRWKKFSAPGFFTPDLVEEIKPLLAVDGAEELQALFLELLHGSDAVKYFIPEISNLVVHGSADSLSRNTALDCLLSSDENIRPVLKELIASGDRHSMLLAAQAFTDAANVVFPEEYFLNFFEQCLKFSPHQRRALLNNDEDISELYYLRISKLIHKKDLCVRILRHLAQHANCSCALESGDCQCKDQVTNISTYILDRYVELSNYTLSSDEVWTLIEPMNYRGLEIGRERASYKILANNRELRRDIQGRIFTARLTEADLICIDFDKFHPGLRFQEGDSLALFQSAFDTENVLLWDFLIPRIFAYNPENNKEAIEIRSLARKHAQQSAEFLRKWSKSQERRKKIIKEDQIRRKLRKRMERRSKVKQSRAVQHVKSNTQFIESGANYQWIDRITRQYLHYPNEIEEFTYGLINIPVMFENFLTHIETDIPSLEDCATDNLFWKQRAILAACLSEFRATGSVTRLNRNFLLIARTQFKSYNGIDETERSLFQSEVDKAVFATTKDEENFLQSYLAAQLQCGEISCDFHQLQSLPNSAHHLKTKPALWLEQYPNASEHSQQRLFHLLESYGSKAELIKIIEMKCDQLNSDKDGNTSDDLRRFWLLQHFWHSAEINLNFWDQLKNDENLIFELSNMNDMRRGTTLAFDTLSASKISLILKTFVELWPPVPLPDHWGTGSPKPEIAFRFLKDLPWKLSAEQNPDDISNIEALLEDSRMVPFRKSLKNRLMACKKASALKDHVPPGAAEICSALDQGKPASVEHMRIILVEFFDRLQKDIFGGDLGLVNQFYSGTERLNENEATQRVVNWMRPRLEPLGFIDVIEHQLANENRCDITATIQAPTGRKMLVIEAKGQWNRGVLSAAKTQLFGQYSIHPTAEEQGIYLVYWYGANEKVAGRQVHDFKSAADLKLHLETNLPSMLKEKIDVVVLDLTRV